MPAGPRAGVRIIELTPLLMGPFAPQMPGDMGADSARFAASRAAAWAT